MQYAIVFIVMFLTTVASQNWQLGKLGDVGGDDYLDFDRYITNKRAINGQLRRSSIRWGKRTSEQDLVPLIPDDIMALWPLDSQEADQETTTATITTATPKPENANQEARRDAENSIMERVAKGGIRPKLALSSRLWGR